MRVPNGFDPDVFERRPVPRLAHWRRHLVEEPQGWAPGREAGSVAYTEDDLRAVRRRRARCCSTSAASPASSASPLLIEAYARARPGFVRPRAAGDPRRLPGRVGGRAPAGGDRAHGRARRLPRRLARPRRAPVVPRRPPTPSCCPSVREQFGQVLVEGMACGLPAIAVDAHGPSEVIDHGDTGWLVGPDDLDALANALVEAVNRPEERARRGERARDRGARALRVARARGAGGPDVRGRARGPRRRRGRARGRLTQPPLRCYRSRPVPCHASREHPLAATPSAD